MFLGHHAMHRRNPGFLEHPSGQKIFFFVASILLILFFIYANHLLNNLDQGWNPTPAPALIQPQ